MPDTRRADAFEHFLYDPTILGFSDHYFSVATGSPTVTSDAVRLDETTIYSRPGYAGGEHTFELNIPSAPSGGDDRSWGLQSPSDTSNYVIKFEISGSDFQAITKDEDGNTTTTDISWNSYDGSDVKYKIIWKRNYIEFQIDGQQVAHHAQRVGDAVPEFYPIPQFIKNANADSTDMKRVLVDEAQLVQKQADNLPSPVGETLANVTAGSASDGTYEYYVDMHNFRFLTLQFDWTPGSGSVTLTVEGTTQDDGTQPENCSYQDITNEFFGVSSDSGDTVYVFEEPVTLKYIKLKVAVSSSDASTAWQAYAKKQR